MAEILTYDESTDPVIVGAQEEAEAEALEIGQKMQAEQAQLLAGKYKSAADLEKAYIELQRKLGQDGSEAQSEDSEPAEEEETSEDEPSEEPSSDPQMDALWKANNEFAEKGELSAETLEQFNSMSSKELVEAYIRLQKQNTDSSDAPTPKGVELSDAEINQIKNSVGGETRYQQLIEWAGDNFSDAETAAFNNVVDSGNKDAIGFAIQALKARYQDSMGYEGEMLSGKAAPTADVFRSQAELVRAMSDPRYDNDPAYRQDIINKVERSGALF